MTCKRKHCHDELVLIKATARTRKDPIHGLSHLVSRPMQMENTICEKD